MSDSQQQEFLAITGPTMKDRIPHPYILGTQILTIQKAILNLENSEFVTQQAVEGLIHAIPTEWKDDQFQKDEKAAYTEKDEDVRPEFCGVKASEEFCKAHGIEISHKTKELDCWKGMQACIDLLNRRGLLTKIKRIEELEELDDGTFDKNEVLQRDLPNK